MICFYLFKIASCITMLMTTRWFTLLQKLTLFWQTLSTTVKMQSNQINSMKENPDKFQFMVLSSDPLEQQRIEIDNDKTLLSEPSVKLLGVMIDHRLQFNDHISAMCCRAARLLNALARISKHLDSKSKHTIYNSFVASNFNYCPLVWYFCGQVNNNKLEKLQERSLRIIHNDYESSFETLPKCSKQESLLTKRLKIMILEVFKTVNRLNPNCLYDLFTKNEVVYDMRTQKLEQPKRRTTTYGLRTFSYLGSDLWNLLASEYSEVNDIDNERLKFLIKYWAGPNHDSAQGHFLWSTFCVLHVYFRNHFFINLNVHTILHCIYLHYLYVVYQPFWLMLFVVHTTLNKFYLI